jgi:hypothetical protein
MPKKRSAPPELANRSTVQHVLAGAKAAMENFARPQTEAGDRVERIMRGEDPLALWNSLFENRWNRKRKLLPNLRLAYPSDDELRRIAELAKVENSSSFGESICGIILDAHLLDASFRTLSARQVRDALNKVANKAAQLAEILGTLDVGRGSTGSLDAAGKLIELELSALQQFKVDGMVLLPEYTALMDALSIAAQRAASKPTYSPRGASGNPAFDKVIERLVMTARMYGGSWTNYRSTDQTWNGTLLSALGILEKYLPQKVFPAGELGRSVEHIRKRLKEHITRARSRA